MLSTKLDDMKLTNKIINAYGADKLLHSVIAGWIVSISGFFSIFTMIITTILVLALSIAKEVYFDNNGDKYDIYAALYGILMSWVFYGISMLC